MNMKIIISAAVGAAIALPLAFSVVSAEAAKMKAAKLQDGDCKAGFEAIVGQDHQVAKALWQQMVATKFGNKWSIWAGAKDKSLVPVAAAGGAVHFRAMAKPCFYNPVP